MPPSLPEHAVVGLLRQCFTTPRCQAPARACNYHQSCSQTRPAHRKTTVSRTLTTTSKRHSRFTSTIGSLPALRRHRNDQIQTSPCLRGFSQSVHLAQHGGQDVSQPEKIAVLGGGITGLASAHYLAREKPEALITVYEGSNRLGGWLQSKKVEVKNGSVLFEGGPRTLRCNSPAAMVTLELVSSLHIYTAAVLTMVLFRSPISASKTRFL